MLGRRDGFLPTGKDLCRLSCEALALNVAASRLVQSRHHPASMLLGT
jgi:hypothetical protein